MTLFPLGIYSRERKLDHAAVLRTGFQGISVLISMMASIIYTHTTMCKGSISCIFHKVICGLSSFLAHHHSDWHQMESQGSFFVPFSVIFKHVVQLCKMPIGHW